MGKNEPSYVVSYGLRHRLSAVKAAGEASSKGRPLKQDRSLSIAKGYARKSQAASVITGQQVRSGLLMRRSCSTHAAWCSSDSDSMATMGPVSTSMGPFKSHQIHRNVQDWC